MTYFLNLNSCFYGSYANLSPVRIVCFSSLQHFFEKLKKIAFLSERKPLNQQLANFCIQKHEISKSKLNAVAIRFYVC